MSATSPGAWPRRLVKKGAPIVDATTCRLVAGIVLMLVLLAGEIYLGHEVLSIISKLLT